MISEDRSFTWAQWSRRVARMAAVLRDQGVGTGDRVAILADNHDLYLAAFFAIPWAGAIIMPVNLRLSGVEIADQIDAATPSLVLHDEARGHVSASR